MFDYWNKRKKKLLQTKLDDLMQEAYMLSKVNLEASKKKQMEAQLVQKELVAYHIDQP